MFGVAVFFIKGLLHYNSSKNKILVMTQKFRFLIFIYLIVCYTNIHAQESSVVSNFGHYGKGTPSIIIVSGSGHMYNIPSPGPNVSGVSLPAVHYYYGSGGVTSQAGWKEAKSILSYQYQPGDVVQIVDLYVDETGTILQPDSNGNAQHGFIITSNRGSTFLPDNAHSVPEVNTIMLNNFTTEATRPNFCSNSYDAVTNTVTENIYKSIIDGPILVESKVLKAYSGIPRLVKSNPNFAPMSPFDLAGKMLWNNSKQLSLYDGYRIIRDRLDYTIPDIVLPGNDGIGLREEEIKAKVLPGIRESLPENLKPDAEAILALYVAQCDQNPDIHPELIMNNLLDSQKATK